MRPRKRTGRPPQRPSAPAVSVESLINITSPLPVRKNGHAIHKTAATTEFIEKVTSLVPGLITIFNVHTGQYLYVNDALTKILGYSKKEFLEGGIAFAASLIHPEDLEPLIKANNEAILKANKKRSIQRSTNPIVTFEYRLRHKDGSWRWLYTDGVVFDRNAKGDIEFIMNISIDITKRKESELNEIANTNEIKQALQKNEERLRLLLEHSTDAITLIDKDGKRLYSTPSRKNILGYDNEPDIGQNVFDLIHPDDKLAVYSSLKHILKGENTSLTMMFRVMHEKGHWIWVEATGTNLLHIQGINAVVVNYKDVSLRKQAQDKLQFLERASNILMSSINYETTIKNIANLIVPTLADYCRIVVKDEKGITSEVGLNHVDPKMISYVKKLYAQYKNNLNPSHGVGKILATGEPEIIPVLTPEILAPVKNNKKLMKTLDKLQIKSYMGVPLKSRGKIIGAITFSSIKDNFSYSQSDLYFAQELAYRVASALDNARAYANEQKAVELRDNFISIASHELKTPVTSIKGFTQLLQKKVTDNKTTHYLSRLDHQVTRLMGLINNLLDVSKIQRGKLDLNKETINVHALLQEIASDVHTMMMSHKIMIKCSKTLQVSVDRYRISQVIINLLTNAIKYSPSASTVVVTAKATKKELVILIQDFGIGIEEKNLHKIFEPFYQADNNVRQSFGGLGLGLHISKEIIQRHGGDISVTSTKGKGSVFRISLPLR